ncbi:RNase adapter RapZ [Ligilactobacillus ceti]|uniref:ATP-binding protein n=1 Tax=Ligilactobacillus ceti DSM 22408 TaxID=1122146 RepID=A0A0R2KVP8_9LACO|nr:RNase adapter RapZ [Ligilactobacillus ceti]KRN90340.1 ATP-binding protein [Ligilactobacillus ceti DSM 22408]
MLDKLELVIITGMSGAGKTVAIQSFEDLGYFCVDNMPPTLLPKFWELITESDKLNKVALVIDLRSKAFYEETLAILKKLSEEQAENIRVLFLDASNEELVIRYKETRRKHPLNVDGGVLQGIELEREMLEPIKVQSQLVIDTSDKTPRKLREEIFKRFSQQEKKAFHIEVMSFGFKYGIPIDADIVMDVRFLPNPYYIPELRNQTGCQKDVADYVMKFAETKEFITKFEELLQVALAGYQKEGRAGVTIAIGCTGGQHRSVAITNQIGEYLKEKYQVNIAHRDINKRKETVNRS